VESLVSDARARDGDASAAPHNDAHAERSSLAAAFDGAYAGRRVLVTGDTGFKGSWLCAWLERLGAVVGGYALAPPTDPSLFELLGLRDDIEHVGGDVRDAAALAAAVAAFAPEVVFHLAAQPLVRFSYADPRGTFESNVMGVVNLFEAVRACPSVRAVVNVTSDKCYENDEAAGESGDASLADASVAGRGDASLAGAGPKAAVGLSATAFAESAPLGGRDPYSASKGCSEIVTAAYRRSFFGPGSPVCLASARAGNVIGGGDWASDRLVPDCVRALLRGDEVVVRRPDAVRPWQHVLESLAGYLWLGARLLADGHARDGAWNFGPAGAASLAVADVVAAFLSSWGGGSWRAATSAQSEPHEAALLLLDCAKARDELGLTGVWNVRTAVARTAAWYRVWAGGAATRDLVDGDITGYSAAAAALGLPWAAPLAATPAAAS
jgi:CDP-glucose 4,6-dehydratase